jgi:hypothetical protein
MPTGVKIPPRRGIFEAGNGWESLDDLGRWLGLSPRTLARWCEEGIAIPGGTRLRLSCVWIGGQRRSSRECCRHFLERVNKARGLNLASLGVEIE